MFIETVPNRDSPPAVLLRESYRDENGRTQKRTLANLSKLPDDVVVMLKAILKGGTLIGTGTDELQIERSLPHGHVAAALGMIRQIALDRLILSTAKDAASGRYCDLVLAMMVDRLIAPRSKLGFVRAVDEETAVTSLGAVLGLGHDHRTANGLVVAGTGAGDRQPGRHDRRIGRQVAVIAVGPEDRPGGERRRDLRTGAGGQLPGEVLGPELGGAATGATSRKARATKAFITRPAFMSATPGP